MTRNEWTQAQAVIGALWPHAKEMTDEQLAIQCDLLAAVSRGDALAALRSIATTGAKFPPGPGEILAEVNAITSPPAPTFEEMMHILFFNGRSPLYDRPAKRAGSAARRIAAEWAGEDIPAGDDETTRPALTVAEQCAELHPLIESFVSVQTPERLRDLPLLDEQHGKWAIKDLRDAWVAHVDTHTGRERRRVITGRGSGSLARLNPLAALEPATRQQLPVATNPPETRWKESA